MSDEVLEEEMQVLESIYSTELTKISEREIQFDIEPEEPVEGGEELKLTLKLVYPETYPDVLPEFTIEPTEGDLDAGERDSLIDQLNTVGEENLGMAVTFTLVSHLREQLSLLVRTRLERRQQEEKETERRALEEEEARTKGTPVTIESFKMWKDKFDKEMARKKAREEEERLKGLSPKERDEYKKLQFRLSGRQLFERNRNLEDEALLIEEGTVSVDASQYERINEREDEQDSERLEFSDSD
ncbi:RWD-domain-containing protein [Phellopilus nigrolimitatus]|nr:RWD-domain-containing protein [Phellopilus nigrolimitatus]